MMIMGNRCPVEYLPRIVRSFGKEREISVQRNIDCLVDYCDDYFIHTNSWDANYCCTVNLMLSIVCNYDFFFVHGELT